MCTLQMAGDVRECGWIRTGARENEICTTAVQVCVIWEFVLLENVWYTYIWVKVFKVFKNGFILE